MGNAKFKNIIFTKKKKKLEQRDVQYCCTLVLEVITNDADKMAEI